MFNFLCFMCHVRLLSAHLRRFDCLTQAILKMTGKYRSSSRNKIKKKKNNNKEKEKELK